MRCVFQTTLVVWRNWGRLGEVNSSELHITILHFTLIFLTPFCLLLFGNFDFRVLFLLCSSWLFLVFFLFFFAFDCDFQQ